MTNTEFIMRTRGEHRPLFKAGIQFRPVDGMFILGFLAAFVGLVFLLAK